MKEDIWEVEESDRWCYYSECDVEFKDGDSVFVSVSGDTGDGYGGAIDLWCKEHAPEWATEYKVKIIEK